MPGILRTWLQRKRHPATPSTPRQIRQARSSGTAAAYRRSTALLLMIEVMLWAALPGVAVAGRGIWIAAVGLLPVGLVIWWVSRWIWSSPTQQQDAAAQKGRSRPGGECASHCPWELVLLLVCAVVDAFWLLHCLMQVLHRLMPSYPAGILRVVVPALLTAGVLLGKRNGAAYGISLWRWSLPLLAVWVMAHVLRNQGLEQLHPLLGRGWKATGTAALAGLGSLWPCAMLFLLPECTPMRTGGDKGSWRYVLLPLLAGCLLAVALACCAAWHAAGTDAGYRLLLAGRHGGSMILHGLWALFWLLGLMAGFCTLLMTAQKLTKHIWPRCPRWLPALAAALPAAALLWIWPQALPPLAMRVLPWRILLWALAAAWAGIRKAMRCLQYRKNN